MSGVNAATVYERALRDLGRPDTHYHAKKRVDAIILLTGADEGQLAAAIERMVDGGDAVVVARAVDLLIGSIGDCLERLSKLTES